MKILLPDIIDLHPDLPDGWEAARVDARAPIPAEHHDAAALVVWGSSRRHLASAAHDLPDLRLVQSLAAGVDGILAAGFDENVVVATGAGLHSRTVAEHALALVLALLRRLPEARIAQEQHEWADELGGLQELNPSQRLNSLLGAQVLIWGFGEIGRTLAGILDLMGASVRGVARSAGERGGFEVIDQTDVMEALPGTDILIDVLPASEATHKVIDAEVFAALPDRALVINVGRGPTLDQEALVSALENDRIAAAALDVTDPEPLPGSDPLWDAPRLLITPHGAGGRPVGADERIAANLRALTGDGAFLHTA